MDIQITDKLQHYLTKSKQLYYSLKCNNEELNRYFQEEYKHLIGKKVKFINKGYNTGIIVKLFPKVEYSTGKFYLNVDVKGADNKILLFREEELELLD